MAKPSPGRLTFPFSLQHFARLPMIGTPSDQIMGSFFIPNMVRDYFWEVDDFNTSTMVAAKWASTAASGTAFAYNAQRGGALRGATGAVANATVNLLGNLIFDAADNPGMYIRFLAPSALASTGFEMGFVNALTDTTLVATSAATAAGVPTAANGWTDGSIVSMNTGYTLTTAFLGGVGTSTAITGTTIGTYTPTASKYIEVVVVASTAKSTCRITDNGVDQGGFSVASGADTAVALRPYFLWKTIGGTTRQIDIDVIALWSERNRTS